MVQLIQHLATLGDITGTAGTIARFKSGGGLEISQITESLVMLLLVEVEVYR
jgi:hypothetical protein